MALLCLCTVEPECTRVCQIFLEVLCHPTQVLTRFPRSSTSGISELTEFLVFQTLSGQAVRHLETSPAL